MNITQHVATLGQSLWLDNLSRSLLHDGTLARLVAEDGISGVTSNPSIFQKALASSPYYADDLMRLKASEPDAERRYEALVIPDIQAACDLLRPTHEASGGNDGYVSLEVAPRWAYDSTRTVEEAQRLSAAVNRRNLLVKVPGTPEGVSAFETLTMLGINVNVTLLFSVAQTEAIFHAFIRGLNARIQADADVRHSKAVASLFLSRVDTLVDSQLTAIGTQAALSLRGKAAVAMARLAYQRYLGIFHGEAFAALAQQGATPQYLLWASTGVKNPDYRDLLYVEPLIGAETINTLPDKTLAALRDHGDPTPRVEEGVAEAEAQLAELARLGIDMDAVGNTLQDDGVKLFEASFQKLLQQTG
ncbi:MAG: transaldolase [Thiobacillus sp. 63-78]|uniref:transaldolase n=1 Tax=Thiobacillus sp. 63-78 TaxID=1895859 RepID=UPI0009630A25|nr:transaldolase [Thiobacillus sp. 63-78]MBN8762880.1 transaldolase [Thiobacillus sp.]MBN8772906.1 transaldolase [Thiobacillus sp.]OJZ07244.1 MAG: transaldolase [Thiobacillus sp. 63-78]